MYRKYSVKKLTVTGECGKLVATLVFLLIEKGGGGCKDTLEESCYIIIIA
jgi:hypothetical protein